MQDYEKCLWTADNQEALRKAGFDVLKQHTKYSPDLNAIEGWWKRLRERLDATAPTECETREEFLVRLRRTVNWLNDHCDEEALKLCTNQKKRARAVLELEGAKCAW